ncbi:oxidoreductase [Candidatus Mycoplasma pogonae]
MNLKYQKLFEPIKIKNSILHDRFVLSPLTLNISENGFVSQGDIDYALRRSKSAALSITSAAYINLEGRIFDHGFGVDEDAKIAALAKLAKAMKANGAKAILQLVHAGRFSTISLETLGYVVGPSPLTFMYPYKHRVRELTIAEIKDLIKDYQKATWRAIQAGFDGVEVSSAQKLIIQSFFSPFSNKRTDQYGATSIANRSRLAIEVLQAVKQVINEYASPDFILGYRATAEETLGGEIGYPITDFLEFLDLMLEQTQIDYLALASWGREIYKYQVQSPGPYFGEIVNKVVYQHVNKRVPVIVSGGINTPEKCLEALQHGDLVGLSSVFVADPEFVTKIKNDNLEQINLHITLDNLADLAIPQNAFNKMVQLMDFGESLPQDTRDELRKLETKAQ